MRIFTYLASNGTEQKEFTLELENNDLIAAAITAHKLMPTSNYVGLTKVEYKPDNKEGQHGN